MKSLIKYGGILRCDMVTVTKDQDFKKPCQEIFVTYSLSNLVRAQAANADWSRVKARLVKWPGTPPVADAKKVDLCPKHSAQVMTVAELKAYKLQLKEQKKAEKKPKIKPDKPRAKPRKKKEAPASP